MTTNNKRLQSRNPRVITAIHQQPLQRSENPWLTVRVVVCGLIQRPAGAHARQRVERVADQVPHDGARDGAGEEDSYVDGLPYRAYVLTGQPERIRPWLRSLRSARRKASASVAWRPPTVRR